MLIVKVVVETKRWIKAPVLVLPCLLYTSDAADE